MNPGEKSGNSSLKKITIPLNWRQTDEFREKKQKERNKTLVETDGNKTQEYWVKQKESGYTKTIGTILEEVNTTQSNSVQMKDNDNTYTNGRGETIGIDEDGDVSVLKYKNGPGDSPFEDPEEYREKI